MNGMLDCVVMDALRVAESQGLVDKDKSLFVWAYVQEFIEMFQDAAGKGGVSYNDAMDDIEGIPNADEAYTV